MLALRLPSSLYVGMTSNHPRTGSLVDPKVPALEVLLTEGIPEPLQAALASEGLVVVDSRPVQVTWQPGTRVHVRYQTTLAGAGLDGPHQLVAASGRIPSGALVVESDDFSVGVWRVPHDPKLPGFPAAVDRARVSQLLWELGAPEKAVTARLRAYRPGRRAVIEARGVEHSIYLKVLRTERVEQLHRNHLHLGPHLPVPESLGFSNQMGIVALQTLPGVTLRTALEDPRKRLPRAADLIGCLSSLPAPTGKHLLAASVIERVPEIAALLRSLLPERADRVACLVDSIGEETVTELVPVHGDFYEAQAMVDRGAVVGLLDLDTYGWGRPADDLATMIGHLAVWQSLSSQPERVRNYGQALLRIADRLLDPIDLRRRISAVVLSLAPGPFRVLLPDWPIETERRIGLAERWTESALRVDKESLITASPRS